MLFGGGGGGVVREKVATSCRHYVVPGGEDRGVIHVKIG